MTLIAGALSVFGGSTSADDLASKLLQHWGASATAVAILIIAAAYFDLFSKVGFAGLKLLAFVFRFAKKRTLQQGVAARINGFLDRLVFPRIAEADHAIVAIEFVESPAEVREHADGRVIVRMRQDRDQDLNALLALSTAITQVFHPHIRGWLTPTTQLAIDLQIVSELASAISDRARKLFNVHIMEPRLHNDARLTEVVPKIHAIAEAGLFESVLLQELSQLSDRHVRRPPSGLGSEVDDFIQWLHWLATREPGDESGDLDFIGSNIQAGALLAAKRQTALHGAEPYRRRAVRNFFKGTRDLYVLGLTAEQRELVEEIASCISDDGLAHLVKKIDVQRRVPEDMSVLRLAMFRRDEVRFSGMSFAEFARGAGVEPGATVTAAIREVSTPFVSANVGDVDVVVPKNELAWGFRGDASWLVTAGAAITLRILEIVEHKALATASAKRVQPNPWESDWRPARGERIRAEVVGVSPNGDVTVRVRAPHGAQGDLYGLVPASDWSWYERSDPRYVTPNAGTLVQLRVTTADPSGDQLLLSRATLESRDWETVGRRYPNGRLCRARVVRVDYDGVRCELEEGVYGRIDRPELIAAGFEYADYRDTVVAGQAIDVIVIGRRHGRQFLRLALTRTRAAEA